jgi:hypothetical protein
MGATAGDRLARFVLRLHALGLIKTRDRVIRGGLDPKTSLPFVQLSDSVPPGTMTALEMHEWMVEQSEYLDELIAAYKDQ